MAELSLKQVQKAGALAIEEVRENSDEYPELALVLELHITSEMMKPSYRPGAIYMANRVCELLGYEADLVHEQAVARIGDKLVDIQFEEITEGG